MDNEKLSSLDVFKYYDQKVKCLVSKNTNEYIDSLFTKSNYNKKLIDELAPKVEYQQKQIEAHNKKFFNKPTFLGNLKKAICCFIIFSLIGLTLVLMGSLTNVRQSILYAGIGILSGFSVLLIVFIILYFKWKKKSKIAKEAIEPIINQNQQYISQMLNEMSKVTSLIKARECFDIYEKSFPSFKINNHISNDDYDLWDEILDLDNTESLYSEIHGGVFNHPYMHLTLKSYEMRDVPYTGSTTIMITTRDSNGSFTTKPVIVTATILKPKPFFEKDSHFVYKIGAYPELIFHSLPPLSSEHQVKSFYKKNKNYSPMENIKFDMLLPCERNNDLQFHTVFSIYTQEQIVNCIKQYDLKKLELIKHGLYVYTNLDNELSNKGLVYSGNVFLNHTPEVVRNNFINAMNNNMKYLYQYMSPIFSVGLFQQERFKIPPTKSKKNNAFGCMVEKIINSHATIKKYFNRNTSSIVYDGIPTVESLYQTINYNVSRLTLNSFSHTAEIEYVNKFAYGRMVSVPVHYEEYNKINSKYLTLSWINDKNMQDFAIENKNEYMKNNKIIGIYKYVDQVVVVFDSSITSIKGKETTIINGINKILC